MKNLKSMSFDELLAHRDEVHRHINKRAAAERKELEAKLARLDGHGEVRVRRGRKVAPKYRDPKSKLTWAGRGARPRWLQAYLKEGRKQEEFLIKELRAAIKKRVVKRKRRAKKK